MGTEILPWNRLLMYLSQSFSKGSYVIRVALSLQEVSDINTALWEKPCSNRPYFYSPFTVLRHCNNNTKLCTTKIHIKGKLNQIKQFSFLWHVISNRFTRAYRSTRIEKSTLVEPQTNYNNIMHIEWGYLLFYLYSQMYF